MGMHCGSLVAVGAWLSEIVAVGPRVRAVVHDRYGPPEVLRIEELPEPAPAAGQVLVQVEATDLCVAGELGIHIDRAFPLDEVPAALAHVGEGRALGKVVVSVK